MDCFQDKDYYNCLTTIQATKNVVLIDSRGVLEAGLESHFARNEEERSSSNT